VALFRKTSRRDFFLGGCVLIMYLKFPDCLNMLLQVFICTESVEGRKMLRYDMSVECGGAVYWTHAYFAGALATAFALGLPSAVVRLGRADKRHLQSSPIFQFLFGGYSAESAWWEAVVLWRKIVLQFITVFVASPNIQAALSSFVIVLALAYHLHRRPYVNTYLNNVDTATLAASFVTQFGTTLADAIEQNYGEGNGSCSTWACSIIFALLTVMNVLLVAFFSAKLAWMWAHTIWRKLKDCCCREKSPAAAAAAARCSHCGRGRWALTP
jgi:hypothetical protein